MSHWFYYNKDGEKVGPVSGMALKALASQGHLRPETVLENAEGRQTPAEKIKGLEFPPPEPPAIPPLASHSQSAAASTGANGTASSVATNTAATNLAAKQAAFDLADKIMSPYQPPTTAQGQVQTTEFPRQPPAQYPLGQQPVEPQVFGQQNDWPQTFGNVPFGPQTVAPQSVTPQSVATQAEGQLPPFDFQAFGQSFDLQSVGQPLASQPFGQQAAQASMYTTNFFGSSGSGYDYERIAEKQRLSSWSVLAWLLAGGFAMFLSLGGDVGLVALSGLLRLTAVAFSLFCVWTLAAALQYGIAARIGFILCLVPGAVLLLPALIPLYFVYARAGRVLKKARYRVGLIGADMKQFRHRPIIPEGIKVSLFILGMLCIPVWLVFFVGFATTRPVIVKEYVPAVTMPLSEVYYNVEHNFSIRYPKNWEIAEHPETFPDALVAGIGPEKDGVIPNFNVITETSRRNEVELAKRRPWAYKKAAQRNYKNQFKAEGTTVIFNDYRIASVAGIDGVLIHTTHADPDGTKVELLQVMFYHNGRMFSVSTGDGTETFEQNRPIFDSIITSIRFGGQAERPTVVKAEPRITKPAATPPPVRPRTAPRPEGAEPPKSKEPDLRGTFFDTGK